MDAHLQQAARRQESRRPSSDRLGGGLRASGEVAGAKEMDGVHPKAAESPSWFGVPALHLGTHKRPPPGANDATTGKEKQQPSTTTSPTDFTNATATPHAPWPT